MHKSLIVVLLLALGGPAARASWDIPLTVAPFAAGPGVHAPVLLAPDGALVAATLTEQRTAVAVSSDRGLTWTLRVGAVTGAAARSEGLVAVGAGGRIDALLQNDNGGMLPTFARSLDGGTSWSPAHSVPEQGYVALAAAPDGRTAAACQPWPPDGVRVRVSADAGMTWSAPASLDVADPDRTVFVHLVWTAADSLLACWSEYESGGPGGQSFVACARSSDGGATFPPAIRLAATAVGEPREIPIDIAVRAPSDVLLVAARPTPAGGELLVLRSLDGGGSWSAPALLASGDFFGVPSVVASAAGEALIAVKRTAAAPGDAYLLERSLDGAAWTAVPLPAALASCTPRADFVDDTMRALPVGAGEIVLARFPALWRTADAGLTWSAADALPPGEVPSGVAIDRAPGGSIVGLWGARADGHDEARLRASFSGDDGATWSAPADLGPMARQSPRVHARAGGGWVAAWHAPTANGCAEVRAAVSADGVVWSPSVVVEADAAMEDGEGLTVADDGVGRLVLVREHQRKLVAYLSADDGATWSAPLILIVPAPLPASDLVRAADGSLVFAAYLSWSGYVAVRTTDGGQTWTQVVIPSSTGIRGNSVQLVAAGARLFAVTTYASCFCTGSSSAFESTTAGVSWSSLPAGLVRDEPALLAGDVAGDAYLSSNPQGGVLSMAAPGATASNTLSSHLPGWWLYPTAVGAAPGVVCFLYETWYEGSGVYYTCFDPARTTGLRRDDSILALDPRPDLGALFPVRPYLDYLYSGMYDPDGTVAVDHTHPLVLYDGGPELGNILKLTRNGTGLGVRW